jgi:vacuolar-type H+-ATPase subunit F/Vma7
MAFHIIGDQDTVLGFRFAGVTGTVADDVDSARKAFARAVNDPACRILLITEAVEVMLEDDLAEHRVAAKPPYLVVVEDIWGSRGTHKSLQDLIYEAVGIRIVKED